MAPIDKYMDEIKKVYPNDVRMQEHCRKRAYGVIELSNGMLLTIDKPEIRKSFYFGEDERGYGTPEHLTMANAHKMCDLAKSWQYFRRKNIEDIDETIRLLDDTDRKWYVCKILTHLGADRIVTLHEDYEGNWDNRKRFYLDLTDVTGILLEYRAVREKHLKRIKTWWKRYGEKHIIVGTYWMSR